ncbi:Hypp599 [Branchiostoma lanceolatum]|uniref:Hypp599 protein n=1 Tax=Branchiostoma lanceolatum TaxID=7740 RepID=A0A8J9YLJ7_BRALA|nr:Hypp599 [Branchiostoma lanceolatum]
MSDSEEEGAQAAQASVVYFPFERKWPKFSGVSSGQAVEEWVEEMESAFTLYSTPDTQKAGMFYGNLEGQAKRVVAVMTGTTGKM